MPNRDHDDVARALEALNSGEVADHHEDAGHDDHVVPAAPAPVTRPPQAARPAAPARPTPAANRPTAPGPARAANPAGAQRPASPQSARPATPARAAIPPASRPLPADPSSEPQARPMMPTGTAPPRPAGPAGTNPAARPVAPGAPSVKRPSPTSAARPATPVTSRPAAPTARPAAPSALRPAAASAPSPHPTAEGPAPDDDDAVIVPAPDASVFFHKPEYATKAKRVPTGASLKFRRTVIPILLTGGLIMAVLGIVHFAWTGENNPMGGLPVWLVGVLFAFALLLWVLAGANMMAVKQMMQSEDGF